MNNLGFVFPGQGSQKQGMLAEMATEYPLIKTTFAEASEVLGCDLWKITQDNPEGQLDQTAITQPALLAASIALWRLWRDQDNPLPALLAGHSLGEYSALVAAGVLDFTAAIALVNKRGIYMQEAVPEGTGAMAAILGLDNDLLAKVCQEAAADGVVAAANFNAPGQTVIAGSSAAVAKAIIACKEAGAKRALPLNVSVPSHCALMRPAAERLAEDMNDITFRSPDIPVIQNINGQASQIPDEIKANLLKQLYQPVQWVDSMLHMRDKGILQIIECGPGRVLCGLIKRIDPGFESLGIDDSQALQQAVSLIRTQA
ncbi:MAG: ACP S-malonyltransferase [Pseudomonadales bacterium]|nr:ACP S-malonyltransferase [Pseudomonadales bacterium]